MTNKYSLLGLKLFSMCRCEQNEKLSWIDALPFPASPCLFFPVGTLTKNIKNAYFLLKKNQFEWKAPVCFLLTLQILSLREWPGLMLRLLLCICTFLLHPLLYTFCLFPILSYLAALCSSALRDWLSSHSQAHLASHRFPATGIWKLAKYPHFTISGHNLLSHFLLLLMWDCGADGLWW